MKEQLTLAADNPTRKSILDNAINTFYTVQLTLKSIVGLTLKSILLVE